jgi:hypothetical protein
MAAKLTFDMAASLKKGTLVTVHLTFGMPLQGVFQGRMAGRPTASARRERMDALVVKNGPVVYHIRRGDVAHVFATRTPTKKEKR